MTAREVLNDHCTLEHHCPNAVLLWQQIEDARQAWADDAFDHEAETYRDFRYRERTYRDHRAECVVSRAHRCDSSWMQPTCSLCGKRRPA